MIMRAEPPAAFSGEHAASADRSDVPIRFSLR
jgi:hypothetical protein